MVATSVGFNWFFELLPEVVDLFFMLKSVGPGIIKRGEKIRLDKIKDHILK